MKFINWLRNRVHGTKLLDDSTWRMRKGRLTRSCQMRQASACIEMLEARTLMSAQAIEANVTLNEFIYPLDNKPTPSAHATTIVDMGDGKLVAAWFGGTAERNPDTGIWLSRFDGQVWSNPIQVASGAEGESQDYACWNPVLFKHQDGTLTLFYKVGPTPQTWWGRYLNSTDGGATWSESVKLPSPILGPIKNQPVQLGNGTIINPTSDESNGWRVYFELSQDDGKTWRRVGPVDNNGIEAIQPTILIHPDGHLQALCRSKSGVIVETWSYDNGETWTALTTTSLPNPSSGVDATTLQDGTFALVYNPVTSGRSPLVVALSSDGVNWHDVATLEDTAGSEFSYPTVIQDDHGRLQITYTWKRLTVSHAIVELKNDPPVLTSIESGAAAYQEAADSFSTIPLTSTLIVTDVDNSMLLSATIQFSSGYQQSQDLLTFLNAGKIVGRWNADSGTLTLSGLDTVANYQQAIRAVQYQNRSHAPTTALRTVTIQMTDARGAASNSVARSITVAAVNNPSVLSPVNTTSTYVRGTAAKSINTQIAIADVDSATLSTATISLTTFNPAEDILEFVPQPTTMGNISPQSNANGVLTLTSAGATATILQWQAALRAVSYRNNLVNGSTFSKTVSFQVTSNDSLNAASNTITTTLNVIPPIAPFMISGSSSALSYTEGAPKVAIFPTVTISDNDSARLSRATIKITNNYNYYGAIDTLLFTDTPTIKGTFSIAAGTLTLTGVDTIANYQAAIRSVGFTNRFDEMAPPRTISLSVRDETELTSNVVTRQVNITTVNDAPILSNIEGISQVYKVNDPFVPPPVISQSIIIRDYDSRQMSVAKIKITSGYEIGKERLGFDSTGTGLFGSWDNATGTLTLYRANNGTVPVANLLKALHTVSYVSLGSSSKATRTITFQIADDQGLTSNFVSRKLEFTTTNMAPSVALNGSSSISYIENGNPIVIAPTVTLTDSDSPLIQSAIVKITGNFASNQDKLAFANAGKIKGVFNSQTGTLFLFGSDTIDNYQNALRTVQYFNISENPSDSPRTIGVSVNDGLVSSSEQTLTLVVSPVNDPSNLNTNEIAAFTYRTPGDAVTVAPNLSIADVDSTQLTGATVQIIANYQRTKDILAFVNTAKITGAFDARTGILTLTGTDNLANYKLALSTITYQYVGKATTSMTKIVSFVVRTGDVPSNQTTSRITVTS